MAFTPTPDQIDTFRAAEEEAEYGCPVNAADMRPENLEAARQLVALGFLTEDEDHDFYITTEGQEAFADVGR